MTASEVGWSENRASRGWRLPAWSELRSHRELAVILAMRDLRVRYKQAAFGASWAILQPLAGAVAFTLVFDGIADVPSEGVPYPLFSFVSLSLWTYVNSAVTGAAQSVVNNADMVSKVYFPRLLLPLAGVIPGLVDLAVALLLALPFVIITGVGLGWAALTVPLWMLAGAVAALGIGLILATLHVRYRDVKFALPLLLQIGLFASPVGYPLSVVPEGWRVVYALNPAVAPLEGLRWAMTGTPADVGSIAVSAASGLVLLLAGLTVFASKERRFADVI